MFELCAPSLIYLIFSATQIIIDTFKGLYNTAFFKLIVSIIITILLNTLCDKGLGVISWIIVFIPFMFMSVIVTILLYVFGLDVATGKINNPPPKQRNNNQKLYNSPSPVEVFNPNYNAHSYYPFFQEQPKQQQYSPYQQPPGQTYQYPPPPPPPPTQQSPYQQQGPPPPIEPQPHNSDPSSYQNVPPPVQMQPTILYVPPNTN